MLDLPVILAVLFGGALTIFVVYFIIMSLSNAWPAAAGPESAAILSKGVVALQTFDYMFVIFAVGLGMVTIISGFFIDSHPAFFAFSALLLIPIIILTSAQITNAFDAVASSTFMIPVSNQFPYIVMFMRNLPLFCLIIGIVTAVVTHGKPGGGGI